MASNLSSSDAQYSQHYLQPGLNILKGLKADVVAMQEFNTTTTPRAMVDATFGTNFSYFREPTSYSIPNGIISRYPILSSGSWVDSDTGVNDRGYAWARIDLPGTNDLYVVSVHLKASSGTAESTRRNAEAMEIKSLIQSNFPANAWIVVAGDMNLYSDTEAAIQTFKTFLTDSPIPADQNNNVNTSANRSERYDRVLPSPSLASFLVPVVMPSRSYPNGLVFDSRVYTSLSDVAPVVSTDSGADSMQHMGVVKDFKFSYTVTNFVTVSAPRLSLLSNNIIRWSGVSNVTYTVQRSDTLTNWINAGTATSTSTNFGFTNAISTNRFFYRVTYP
jgi:endonuclease/exonuclease/phosphatase family metal-dependent hydrolase